MVSSRYQGSVVSFRNDRMGARILAILNAIRVSRDYDLPYFFTWMTHGRSSDELQAPTEIFDEDYFNAHFVDRDDFKVINDEAQDLMAMPLGSDAGSIPAGRDKGDAFLCMATDLLVLPWEVEEDVAPKFAAAVSQLVFSKTVQTAMAQVDKTLEGASTAFHIRRGDIIHDVITSNQIWPNKYIPREYYEILANRIIADPNGQILVFSDEPAEIGRLKALGPQIVTPDEVLPKGLTLAQRDFMELYTMSRCAAIIGPPGSGFSAAAALMGNHTVQDIRDVLTPDENHAAMQLLAERLEARSPIFLGVGDIGQNLPFAIAHYNAGDDGERGLALLKSFGDEGFSKVYFFRLLLEQYLKAGKHAECFNAIERFRAADLEVAIPARLELQWSELYRLATIGAVHEGDKAAMQHRLALSLWFHPTSRLAHALLMQLVSEGKIDLNTFPIVFDPNLMRPVPSPATRPTPNTLMLPDINPEQPYVAFPQDLFIWDWRNVLGRTLVRGFNTPQSITRARDIFMHQFPRFAPPASIASAQGVFATALGEHDVALGLHKQALQDDPDNPLFLRRMAATLLAGDPADPIALVLLEKAAYVAPKQGLYRAELGLCLLVQKQRDRGIQILRKLCREENVLPEIPFLTARAMRQNRQSGAEALALIDQAITIAPHIRRYMHMRVHILADMKNFEAANEQVDKIVARFGEGGDLTDLRQRLAA